MTLFFSVQITVFYIIFYACLAAFWIACLAIFLNTLDPKEPRYYGKGTIIGINPGELLLLTDISVLSYTK